ncbi:MAG: SURF1 family cytochrome oxidase biogenesis protein [Naasia sp.]
MSRSTSSTDTAAILDSASADEDGGRPVRVDRRTLLGVMRRPSSLLLLLLAIVMAVGFSLLGQWQLARAFENGAVIESESEQPLAIESEVPTQVQTPSSAVGQLITADGQWVAEDFSVLDGRLNDGASGSWVIGHFLTSSGDSLAVGVGWTPDPVVAAETAERLGADPGSLPTVIEGRYQQSEQPKVDEELAPGEAPSEMAVPALVNEWTGAGPVYAGYLTLHDAPAGLETIYSPAPERQVQLNFLNLFYTLEWAFFAVVALYIWYRHMRDVAERERDEALEAAAGSGAEPAPDPQ